MNVETTIHLNCNFSSRANVCVCVCVCVVLTSFHFLLWCYTHSLGRLFHFNWQQQKYILAQKPACGKIVLRIYQWNPYNFCVLKTMYVNDTLHLFGFAKLDVRKCLSMYVWVCGKSVSSSIHLHNRPRISIPFLVQKEKLEKCDFDFRLRELQTREKWKRVELPTQIT